MATDGAFRIMTKVMASGHDQQSGMGSPRSISSDLWRSIVKSSERLFAGYTPISMSMHACDLIPHVAAAIGVADMPFKPNDEEGNKQTFEGFTVKLRGHAPDPKEAMAAASLPYSYVSMGFVVQTAAMRRGLYIPITETQTDCSYSAGYQEPTDRAAWDEEEVEAEEKMEDAKPKGKPKKAKKKVTQLQLENRAIEELRTLFTESQKKGPRIRILVVEPFAVPGEGRVYRVKFLEQLTDLCSKHNVAIVADETLSFVRCGYPLYSLKPAVAKVFSPPYVLVGKSLGCNLLLVRKDLDSRKAMQRHMFEGFSIVGAAATLVQAALVLHVMRERDIATFCRQNGIALLKQFLESIPLTDPTNDPDKAGAPGVRGIGHCLWFEPNRGSEVLPIQASIHLRLLPRVDQTAATIKRIAEKAAAYMQALKTRGVLNTYRNTHCSLCGSGVFEKDDEQETKRCCEKCIRIYHTSCIDEHRTMSAYSSTCTCGNRLRKPSRRQLDDIKPPSLSPSDDDDSDDDDDSGGGRAASSSSSGAGKRRAAAAASSKGSSSSSSSSDVMMDTGSTAVDSDSNAAASAALSSRNIGRLAAESRSSFSGGGAAAAAAQSSIDWDKRTTQLDDARNQARVALQSRLERIQAMPLVMKSQDQIQKEKNNIENRIVELRMFKKVELDFLNPAPGKGMESGYDVAGNLK